MECYTICIELQPHTSVYHSNRAAALLKLGRLAAAVEDCNAALLLEPDSLKPLFRRALARSGLGFAS